MHSIITRSFIIGVVPGTIDKDRLTTIDYLRGLASLMVAWFHLTNSYSPNSAVRFSGSYGWLGVEIFFVISGFVITYALYKTPVSNFRRYGLFLSRRMTRVEIPYLISIFLVIIFWHLSALVPNYRGNIPDWSIIQIILHIGYLIPFSDFNWLQPVYWTLAYEFVFYLLIGAFFSSVLSYPRRFLFFALVLVGLSVAGLISVFWLLFLLGVAICQVHVSGNNEIFWTVGGTIVVGGGLIWIAMPSLAITGIASASLILFAPRLSLPKPVALVLGFFGAISYSLYLTHVVIGGRVVNLLSRFGEGAAWELGVSLFALIISIGFATLFYNLIEQPSQRLAHKIPVT